MAYSRSATTHATTGVKTYTCGFQPEEAELEVRFAPGASTAIARFSNGSTDGTNQNADSYHLAAARARQEIYTDRMASIWEWDSGTSSFVEVFRANFDSFTATEFKYNVTIANANYQVLRKVRG